MACFVQKKNKNAIYTVCTSLLLVDNLSAECEINYFVINPSSMQNFSVDFPYI